MSLTPEEAQQIKVDIEVLKTTSTQVLQAIGENSEQTKENNKLVHSLIQKMDKHDVRQEYEAKEREEEKEHTRVLEGKVEAVNLRIDNMMPTYQRTKANHESIDKFKDGMRSTWGKMAGALLVIGIAAGLGLDLSNLFKD